MHREAALKWSTTTTAAHVVTTEFVLVEVANHLSAPEHRQICIDFLDALQSHSGVRIVPVSHSLFLAALDLFRDRSDKAWSLTDCASFVVMRDEKILDALTFDRHFEQAGFRLILK
jgi:predicted nucleic acid-binding protein